MHVIENIEFTTDVQRCITSGDIIFIAVKPQYVSVVLNEISGVLTPQSLIVSIAAGVSIDTLQSACKQVTPVCRRTEGRGGAPAVPWADRAGPGFSPQDFAKVIRVMPNTPCLVGEAAAAMCLGKNASTQDESDVRTLMGSVGKIFTCTENLLSAVTGLSGSGPAYIFIMIEVRHARRAALCRWVHRRPPQERA